jgi:sugar phosphate isomerase/epimerase
MRAEVLWSATLLGAGFDVRLDAAAAAGLTGMTVGPADVAALGGGAPAAVRRARDLGVHTLIAEAFTEWYPHAEPPVPFESSSWTIDTFRRAAEVLGCRDVCLVAPFKTDEPLDALAERFGVACDAFAADGVAVHLEFSPFPPIGSLAAAWSVVQAAGRANAGITVDSWHFFRGDPDLDLLRTIPGDRIASVQLNDGAAQLVESLVKDTFRHRRLPGDGTFDLAGLVDALDSIGGLRLVGPEVLSIELSATLAPDELVGRAVAACDRVLSR